MTTVRFGLEFPRGNIERGQEVKAAERGFFRFAALTCMGMNKLSKVIYNMHIGDADAVKALALLVYVKENKPTSVFTDYTVTALAKFANLSRNTTRKRIKKLEEIGLVERIGKNGQHLLFKRARVKCANVNLSKINKDNVRSIELGLKALLIYEIQRSKEWVRQRVYQATNPKVGTPLKVVKRAKAFCRKRGITEFVDSGLSWKAIAKRLGCGFETVKQAIKYGEQNKMFVKHCHIRHYEVVMGRAQQYVEYSEVENVFATKKNNNVYSFACNTYSLC